MDGRGHVLHDGDAGARRHFIGVVLAGLHHLRRHDVLGGRVPSRQGTPKTPRSGRARARRAGLGVPHTPRASAPSTGRARAGRDRPQGNAHRRGHPHGARARERTGENKRRPRRGRQGGRHDDDLRRFGDDGPRRRQQFRDGMDGGRTSSSSSSARTAPAPRARSRATAASQRYSWVMDIPPRVPMGLRTRRGPYQKSCAESTASWTNPGGGAVTPEPAPLAPPGSTRPHAKWDRSRFAPATGPARFPAASPCDGGSAAARRRTCPARSRQS